MSKIRPTGLSIGGVGLQWEITPGDRETAQQLIDLLADRRMLWADYSVEIQDHCVKSAGQAREGIGSYCELVASARS